MTFYWFVAECETHGPDSAAGFLRAQERGKWVKHHLASCPGPIALREEERKATTGEALEELHNAAAEVVRQVSVEIEAFVTRVRDALREPE
jgi:hypothetical protein